jgi:glutamate transport system permease protein
MSAVLYDVAGPRARRRNAIGGVVGALVLLAVVGLVVRQLAANGQFEAQRWTPFVEEPLLWQGTLSALVFGTLQAAGWALVLALVLGVLLACGRLSSQPLFQLPSVAVIEFFRGVPLLLLIFFFFLGFPLAFGINLPLLWALVLGLMLYNGAVIAEIVRAGVLALPRGQTEAALAIGLTRGQTLRAVLLPQSFRIMLPALISQLVVLVKDTSLGFIIGYLELLAYSERAAENLGNPIQMLGLAALIYIVINLSLSRFAVYVEGRQRRQMGTAAAAEAEEAKEEVGRQG